jgi:hypothetical protein
MARVAQWSRSEEGGLAMHDPRSCPICRGDRLERRDGRLDQSGETYLPTAVWSCHVCGYEKWEPALGVRWESSASAPARRALKAA